MLLGAHAMNPTLLRCGYFNGYETIQMQGPFQTTGSSGHVPSPAVLRDFRIPIRTCYDYEIEFFLNSDGGIIVDGKYYPFSQGEINIRKPGQKVAGIAPYECYIICIDLAGKRYLPKNYMFGDRLNAQPDYEDAILQRLPIRLKPRRGERILASMQKMQAILQTENETSSFRVNTLVRDIVCEIFEDILQQDESLQKINLHMSKAVAYINEHFTEDISIHALIASTGLSKAYFHKCFKDYTGVTPLQMIASLRMEKARLLLNMSNARISDIATACGYPDAVYFTSLFKKAYAVTPTAYREDCIRQNSITGIDGSNAVP